VYTRKIAGSALVLLGEIAMRMLAADAKIIRFLLMHAFDQTGFPQIIQVPSGAEIKNSRVPRYKFPP